MANEKRICYSLMCGSANVAGFGQFLGGCNGDVSPVTSLGVQFSSDSLLDILSGSAHRAQVRRNPLTRVIRRKPILSEQALPVLRRSPRTLSGLILVD
jgi:hypothetical protein